MKKPLFLIFFLLFTSYELRVTGYAAADTIYQKDGKEIKGIVLEEYKDRVLISTVSGEYPIMKSEIKELYFDTEEQNLIKLAEQSRDKGDYIKAFVYYDKAFKANPNSKEAKDGIVFLQGYLFKKDIAKKEEDINRRNDFESRGGTGAVTIKTEEEKLKRDIDKLRRTTGLALGSDGATTKIADVAIGSSAYEAGARKGDLLIAVWGRLVGYLSMQEVVEALLEKTSLETKFTVERTVEAPARDNGLEFKMQFDGMTVSAVKNGSGAKKAAPIPGDVIVAVNGTNIRYMPMKKALNLINNSEGGIAVLTFRREVVMWGKEGG